MCHESDRGVSGDFPIDDAPRRGAPSPSAVTRHQFLSSAPASAHPSTTPEDRGLHRVTAAMKKWFAAWMLSLAVCGVVAAAPADYRVKVAVDKHTDFSALHTYAWTRGWASFDPRLNAHIVDAIDRQLLAVGLMRREREPVDVVVSYGTVQRSDVDVSAKRERHSGVYPEYPVGTLVVLMREAHSRRELLRARAEAPVDVDLAQLEEQIDTIVERIFARYPTRISDRP
jgi:Domain of unknown function (DUF4136)